MVSTGLHDLLAGLFGSTDAEELVRLNEAMAGEASGSVGGTLQAWRREVGYIVDQRELFEDDYVGVLHVRDLVERMLEGMSPTLERAIYRFVEDTDALFLAVSEEDEDGRLVNLLSPAPDHWWWRRIPRIGPMAVAIRGLPPRAR